MAQVHPADCTEGQNGAEMELGAGRAAEALIAPTRWRARQAGRVLPLAAIPAISDLLPCHNFVQHNRVTS